MEFQSLVECQVRSFGVRWNSGLVEPRILESGEYQVRSSGVRWNSELVEPGILESGGMPGLEFWSLVEFRVSGTQNSGVQWNARSGVLEAGGILG